MHLLILMAVLSMSPAAAAIISSNDADQVIGDLLKRVPLIDGHNDLAHQIFARKKNKINDLDLQNWTEVHTDIKRMKQGGVGAQIWAVYAGCSTQYRDAVRACLEHLDTIQRFVYKYPNELQMAYSSQEITETFKKGKISSLLGVEGGHCLDSSLSVLRMLYQLGTRYMTLTHNCDTPWVTNNLRDRNATNVAGLTQFGKDIIREMNRLGMIVDMSHVSKAAMVDVLATSVAPVIFSHSNSYKLAPHTRNVQDDVLLLLKKNKGLIMITFPSSFLDVSGEASISSVADHLEYIYKLIGIDHVGIGSDYDGTPSLPVGLEDVSKFPDLLKYLYVNREWTVTMLEKLIGQNFLRVFQDVERVSKSLKGMMPLEDRLPQSQLVNTTCRSAEY
ncbi:hypothetical protein HELRODRAFT_185405 [Helobdella robusta]|uniref:Dipeptidase n=1 Tax=Helobdella robusta TaxID=6412 RepID=T1FMR9_HELRO|nr:hypothetical protein HELRODRAFT_185405 [Helobdella robusta]ESO08645.1 hypothetical protein HELRODRAFT_185405 [Helobdella robusta]